MFLRELPSPKAFLDSALSNFESAYWYSWADGICVGYMNPLEMDSILCWSERDEQGFLLQVQSIINVFIHGSSISILCIDGWIQWDGKERIVSKECPMSSWHKTHISSWGGVGYSNFGYHIWSVERNEVKRLPMGIEKCWATGIVESVLWSYWGQFFLMHQKTKSLPYLQDVMESVEPIVLGGWVALSERTVLVIDAKGQQKRFDSDIMIDVRISSNRSKLMILLADGVLLSWEPMKEQIPKQVLQIDADAILGDDWLLLDEQMVQISQLKFE